MAEFKLDGFPCPVRTKKFKFPNYRNIYFIFRLAARLDKQARNMGNNSKQKDQSATKTMQLINKLIL